MLATRFLPRFSPFSPLFFSLARPLALVWCGCHLAVTRVPLLVVPGRLMACNLCFVSFLFFFFFFLVKN
jgi:hypothetical protein